MRSTRAKGNEVELRIQRWLEDAGWLVHRARQSNSRKPTGKERCGGCGGPMKTQWVSLSNDVFGTFDLLARRRGMKEWAIQVTTGGGASQKRKDVEEHIAAHKGEGALPSDYFVIVWDGASKAEAGKYTIYRYDTGLWQRAFLSARELQGVFTSGMPYLPKWMTLPMRVPPPEMPSLFDELEA